MSVGNLYSLEVFLFVSGRSGGSQGHFPYGSLACSKKSDNPMAWAKVF